MRRLDWERGSGLSGPTTIRASYRRRYAQTRQAVGEARRAIVAFAKSAAFAGQDLDDLEIAAGEALANAFEHGQGDVSGFEVSVVRDETSLTIVVQDGGRGFDPSLDGLHVCPSSDSLRGFGTFIMRELMDEVEYSERGTRLRLTKRLPVARTDERSYLEA